MVVRAELLRLRFKLTSPDLSMHKVLSLPVAMFSELETDYFFFRKKFLFGKFLLRRLQARNSLIRLKIFMRVKIF